MGKLGTVAAVVSLAVGMSWGADKKVTVEVPQKQYEALSKLAEKDNAKVADIIRKAVEKYVGEASDEGAEKPEGKGGAEGKKDLITTAKSKSFEVTVTGTERKERVEAAYDYSYQDGYKTKIAEAPKGMEYVVAHVDIETLAWGKVQSLDGDGMVPGCVLKWKYITLQDAKKRSYPCALLGGRNATPWAAVGDRESVLAKRKDGEVRMKRSSGDGWSHFSNGRKLDIYFVVPKDSGPFKLLFADVDPVDVAPE